MWAAIKKAINSTLGTDDFRPLDVIMTEGRTIVASDEPLLDIAVDLPSETEETVLKEVKFRTSGGLKISVTFVGNGQNCYLYVYKNDVLINTISTNPDYPVSSTHTRTVSFSKNDILKMSYKSMPTGPIIRSVKLCGTVKDISLLKILEG